MSTEQNTVIARRVIEECFNHGNLDCIDELIAEDYVLHAPMSMQQWQGRSGFRERIIGLTTQSLPAIVIEDLFAADEKVVIRYRNTPVRDDKRIVTYSGIMIYRMNDGQISEEWLEYDALGLQRQLSELP
ncbi:MAG: hypothetical protein EXR50_03875 [Dehalococcoidia bacterium]|nr:hypothetical protein [Dehalococcoidia bacterium]